ncbi:MAG: NADH-quinone oxidoreductase subunit NuoE [Fibrobacterota bacterium]
MILGCSCSDNIKKEAEGIVAEVGKGPGKSIPILQKIQEIKGYLPEDLLEAAAEEACIPPSDLYGVATFYSQFRFVPVGKHLIRVCKGTACHVAGADMLISAITDEVGIKQGETSEDGLFSLETVACLGCCSLAPVITVNEDIHGNLSPKKLRKILKRYRDD